MMLTNKVVLNVLRINHFSRMDNVLFALSDRPMIEIATPAARHVSPTRSSMKTSWSANAPKMLPISTASTASTATVRNTSTTRQKNVLIAHREQFTTKANKHAYDLAINISVDKYSDKGLVFCP